MVVHLGSAFRSGGEEAFSLKISPADLGSVREPVAVRQSDKDRLAPELRRIAAGRTARSDDKGDVQLALPNQRQEGAPGFFQQLDRDMGVIGCVTANQFAKEAAGQRRLKP